MTKPKTEQYTAKCCSCSASVTGAHAQRWADSHQNANQSHVVKLVRKKS